MGSATHHIGSAHHNPQACGSRRCGGYDGRWKFRNGDAIGSRLGNMLCGRVIVARDRDPMLPSPGNEVGAVGAGVAPLGLRGFCNMTIKLVQTPAFLAGEIGSCMRDFRPLALARRVVHQR